ncbi:hypothetical protein [Bacteroides ihuae]|uniref:hypothetical protein n=1 Tax=Bacteroides ihuae TaxID=1852362 RepID=UPI0008DA0A2E|nr:hypothetical protein [Bacteroides ihuae]
MKMKIVLFFMLSLSACDRTRSSNSATFIANAQADTIVASKTIPNVTSSLEYREKEYFLVAGKDTSGLSCIFSENKNSGKISLTLEYDDFYKSSLTPIACSSDTSAIGEKQIEHKAPYYKITYRQQMEALRLILKESSKEFDLSKMRNISLMLLNSGDLAIEVTEQYTKKIGTKGAISEYRELAKILAGSRLKSDLDKLLEPYSVFIDSIRVEKTYYVNKKSFLAENKIDTTIKVPKNILDCSIDLDINLKK